MWKYTTHQNDYLYVNNFNYNLEGQTISFNINLMDNIIMKSNNIKTIDLMFEKSIKIALEFI